MLFLTADSLEGSKQLVYVLMKALKLCTASKATSYKIKFAVHAMLVNVDPDKIGLGEAIKMVMNYETIRTKFESVHPDLEKIGIARVEVTEDGLCFVRKTAAPAHGHGHGSGLEMQGREQGGRYNGAGEGYFNYFFNNK